MIGKCMFAVTLGLVLAAGARLAADEPTAKEAKTDKPTALPVIEQEQKPDAELLRSLEEKLGHADHANDPLLRAGRRMREVEQRIVRQDIGDETQAEQKQIVKDLEELIERVKNGQCPSCGGSCSGQRQQDPQQAQKQKPGNSGQKPGAGTSTEGARQAGRGTLEAVQKAGRDDLIKREWGHLPEQERLRVMQQFKEAFLLKYEDQLIRYYETINSKSRAERK